MPWHAVVRLGPEGAPSGFASGPGALATDTIRAGARGVTVVVDRPGRRGRIEAVGYDAASFSTPRPGWMAACL